MENMNEEKNVYVEENVQTKKQKPRSSFWELVRFVFIAIVIVLPIRILIAQPFIVSGSSMFPTFEDNQYLIVDQLSYRFNEPARGDVVIFRYPLDPTKFFIKRVIGLPNEKVVIRGGKVFITDKDGLETELEESYLKNISKDSFTMELGDNEYFVMGDNRTASSDSRVWGPLPRANIIGKAFLRLLPVDTVSVNPGEHHFNQNQE